MAPGSASVWYPGEPAARAVLGESARPISVWPDATAHGLLLFAGLAGLAVAASPAASSPRGATVAALGVVFAGLALSIYAIVARASFGPLLYGRFKVPTVMPFGPYVSKNHFAGYVGMTAIVALGLAFGLKDREGQGREGLAWVASPHAARILVVFGAAFTIVLAVFASLSRGGAIGLLAGSAILAALRFDKRRSRSQGIVAAVLVLCLAAAAVMLLPREAHDRLTSLTGAASEASGSFRLDTWRAALRLARSSALVGSGVGAFVDALPRFKTSHGGLRIEHAENDYVEWLAETGVVGFALGAAALAFLLRAALARLSPPLGRLHRGIAMGAIAAMAALLVHGAVDFNSRIPANAALFLLLASIGLPWRGARLGPGSTAAFALVLLLLAGLSWRASFETPLGGREDIAAAAAIADPVARGIRLERAAAALSATLHRRPADAESWFLLGWTRAAQGAGEEGAALATYGSTLDPQRKPLVDAASALSAGRSLAAPDPR